MIFRGKAPESTVWRRFRSGIDGFTFRYREDAIFEAHIVANAERVVDLLYTLSERLTPAIDISLMDMRSETTWSGQDVALPDVRDAIARLKIPLSTYGGVQLTLVTADDQLTLTPYLGLYVYSRSDKWLYLLQGIGLEQYNALFEKEWHTQAWEPGTAHPLHEALIATADRLSLSTTATG